MEKIYSLDHSLVNEQWNEFMIQILVYFNNCFPLKKVVKRNYKSVKYLKNHPEIRECKEPLDIPYMLKNLNNKFKSLYSEKKKQYDLLLSKYKKQNFSDRLIVSDNKTKTAWAIVNEINGKPKSGDINIKGDGKTIANRFNDHLMNSVSENLSKLVNIPFSSVIIRNPLCVSLKLVNASEIIEISKKIKK